MATSLADKTEKIFEEGGPLSRTLGEYEPRPQQLEMARGVAKAFEDGERTVIEAATGTGKTLAYLVPALMSGKRTVVSTATKNLQEQILSKDIPLLEKVLPRSFTAVVLKGRTNYLCLWKYESFAAEPKFRRAEDVHYWPAVVKWADKTSTGDRAEIDDLPDEWPSWGELSMGSEGCMGRECVLFEECHVTKARRAAHDADLIVVNHHLYFADLALRSQTDAELLPAYQAVVFDEAHNLEETASGYFGMQVSNYRVNDLLGDVTRFLGREGLLSKELQESVRGASDRSKAFFGLVSRGIGIKESRVESSEVFDGFMGTQIVEAQRELETRLSEVQHGISISKAGEVGRKLVDRIDGVMEELAILVDREAADLVFVTEKRGRGVFLNAYPIDLGPVFREVLFSACKSQVFTSATLTTDGDFRFFKERMGLPKSTATMLLEPVFDYMQQAVLFVPEDLPDPSDRAFIEKVVPTMKRLVELCDGRAFLLFTSYRNMNEALRILGPQLTQPLLVQGERSRNALLEAFREDPRSVLFATSSFWEGVDVQGEALSLVVIDKLPFASPGDPVLKARIQHLEAKGGQGFRDFQVPAAAIALKQGFGRLIRHRDDYGIIVILDGRIIRKGYGQRFLKSLPRARRSQNIEVVERWWNARKLH